MKWALINGQNSVVNIIQYDGQREYKAPRNMALVQVNDWVEIGDDKDIPEPTPTPTKSDADKKVERNIAYKDNIALVGAYRLEKRINPLLTFSDYLDQLEAELV